MSRGKDVKEVIDLLLIVNPHFSLTSVAFHRIIQLPIPLLPLLHLLLFLLPSPPLLLLLLYLVSESLPRHYQTIEDKHSSELVVVVVVLLTVSTEDGHAGGAGKSG